MVIDPCLDGHQLAGEDELPVRVSANPGRIQAEIRVVPGKQLEKSSRRSSSIKPSLHVLVRIRLGAPVRRHQQVRLQLQQQPEALLITRLVFPKEIAVVAAIVVDAEVGKRVAGHEKASAVVLDQQSVVVDRLPGK